MFEIGVNDVMVVYVILDSIDIEECMILWYKDVVYCVDFEVGCIYVNWGVDY